MQTASSLRAHYKLGVAFSATTKKKPHKMSRKGIFFHSSHIISKFKSPSCRTKTSLITMLTHYETTTFKLDKLNKTDSLM